MGRRPLNFASIRQQVKCQRVLSLVDWHPRSVRGGISRGPCPIHGSTYPMSRVFVTNGQVCYCHKCKWYGDAIDLFARLASCSKLDAAYACVALIGGNPDDYKFR